MMKRWLSLLCLLFLVMGSLCQGVYAASGIYDLDELGLELTIPAGYSVITRDTPADDPIFSDLGISQSELLSQFEESNIYLNALSKNYNEEIVVTMTQLDMADFRVLSDATLNFLASIIEEQTADYGYLYLNFEIYENSQGKFLKFQIKELGSAVNGLLYYTIYDGMAINVSIRSYDLILSPNHDKDLQAVVDSIQFDKAPPATEPAEQTDAFVYTDSDSGVSFTVPENWKQSDFTEEREFIDVKFASTQDEGCTMIYGSTDMWSQTPLAGRIGTTRSDLNNSLFTKADVAEIYNTTADKITMVTYNGTSYFKCEMEQQTEAYGMGISIPMTVLVHIENGWMYTFQFSGKSDHGRYADFESLLRSVRYPAAPQEAASGAFWGGITVAVVAVLAAVILVVVFCKKKAKARLTQQEPAPKTVACRNCGQALPPDSVFCHICGAKVEGE